MNRKMAKKILFWGDLIFLILVGIFLLADFSGLLGILFPKLNKELIYKLTLIFGVILHFYQRVNIYFVKPRLIIVDKGWENYHHDERLFIEIRNAPITHSDKGKSEETLAEISIYELKSSEEINFIVAFRNVRWEGTGAPKKGDPDRQAYDNRRVDISVGDQRKLYFISRYFESIYYHNDESYSSYKPGIVNWKNPDQLLNKNGNYIVCIKLSSKNFDPTEYWFDYLNYELNAISPKSKVIKKIRRQFRN